MANLQNNISGDKSDDSLHVYKEEYIVTQISQILSAVHGIQCILTTNTKPEIFDQFGATFKFCSTTVNASVV